MFDQLRDLSTLEWENHNGELFYGWPFRGCPEKPHYLYKETGGFPKRFMGHLGRSYLTQVSYVDTVSQLDSD
jgi:hypothetical protein